MPSVEHVPLVEVDRQEYLAQRAALHLRFAHGTLRKQKLSKAIAGAIDSLLDTRGKMEERLSTFRQDRADGVDVSNFDEFEYQRHLEKLEEKIGNFSARKKEIDSTLSDRNKALSESIGDITGILKSGWHSIDVARVLDPFVGELRFVHLQTKEVLRTRPLEPDEKQESLPYADNGSADLRWDQQLEEPDEWTRRVLASRQPAPQASEPESTSSISTNVTPIRGKRSTKSPSKTPKTKPKDSSKTKAKSKRTKTEEAVNA